MDETTGLTQEQPEYDPWGDLWRPRLPSHIEISEEEQARIVELHHRGCRAEKELRRILEARGEDAGNLPHEDDPD